MCPAYRASCYSRLRLGNFTYLPNYHTEYHDMVHFINTNNIYIYIYNVYVDRNTASNIHFINRNKIYNVYFDRRNTASNILFTQKVTSTENLKQLARSPLQLARSLLQLAPVSPTNSPVSPTTSPDLPYN